MDLIATRIVKVRGIEIGGGRPAALIAGPCVIESLQMCLMIGGALKEIADGLGIPYIFKASYDKANRTSLSSYRGPGLEEGLSILKSVRDGLNVPVLSDVHSPREAEIAGDVLDVLQIPAFLCRQTDLVVSAGRSGRAVNVKKGQFLSPEEMSGPIEKILSTGNERILLTERGTTFGYNDLVVDMRSLPRMRSLGYPVIFDATHSVQRPGAGGDRSGGDPDFIPYLSRGAAAVGIDGLFLEVHPDPPRALSDGANALALDRVEPLLREFREIDDLVKGRRSH
ncbi:MAG: 3-deoxy-8-phosphooctulonate synthase [bacterium]